VAAFQVEYLAANPMQVSSIGALNNSAGSQITIGSPLGSSMGSFLIKQAELGVVTVGELQSIAEMDRGYVHSQFFGDNINTEEQIDEVDH
jgi:hypothetical protein